MNIIEEQVKQFHKDGFLVMPEVLSEEECAVLKEDLMIRYNKKKTNRGIMKRMFESSPANLELFWKEPVVTFAEQLISDTDVEATEPSDSFKKGMPSARARRSYLINRYGIVEQRIGLNKIDP